MVFESGHANDESLPVPRLPDPLRFALERSSIFLSEPSNLCGRVASPPVVFLLECPSY
jgi:hypothetical protein